MQDFKRLLLVSITATILAHAVTALPAWQFIELKVYDLFASSARTPPDDVIIVAIDEPSMAEIGHQWPWPRSLHARLVEKLRGDGARAICFDVIFAEPSTPDEDLRLIRSMGPDVILAAEESTIHTPHMIQTIRLEPLPPLLDAGAHYGLSSLYLDIDTVLRRMPSMQDAFAYQVAKAVERPYLISDGELIRFFGPSRTYPTVSYYQALDSERFLPPNIFQDKIVFVGMSLQHSATAGIADMFPTPFTASTGSLLAGVEVQATIFHNAVLGLTTMSVAAPMLLPLTVILSIIIGLGAIRVISPLTLIIFGSTFVVLLAISWSGMEFGRLWLSPTASSMAIFFTFLFHIGWHYLNEAKRRLAIHRAFSQYLSPEMVRRLAEQPDALKLGGERRTLTVIFMDVRGFTTLSEKLRDDPEQLTAILNRLLTPTSEVILAHGGTIDKYIGDCLMAFWNAPLDDSDHADHAVSAAADVLMAVKKLNAEFGAENLPEIHVGIGINTGECVVGNLGSKYRFNYSALGDCVNVAARLESLCKTYDVPVIIGEATAARCRQPLKKIDQVVVRGRNDPTTIFTLPSQWRPRCQRRPS